MLQVHNLQKYFIKSIHSSFCAFFLKCEPMFLIQQLSDEKDQTVSY